jgi:hypothetical protein
VSAITNLYKKKPKIISTVKKENNL